MRRSTRSRTCPIHGTRWACPSSCWSNFRLHREREARAPVQKKVARQAIQWQRTRTPISCEIEVYQQYTEKRSQKFLLVRNPLSVEPVAMDGGSEPLGHRFYVRSKKASARPIIMYGRCNTLAAASAKDDAV